MTFENFIDLFKYLWIPSLAFAYKIYKEAQDKQDKEIEHLKSKISHQMTKDDVTDVVDNAVEKLTLKIEAKLIGIENKIHAMRNQDHGKDSVTLLLIESIDRLNKKLDEKK